MSQMSQILPENQEINFQGKMKTAIKIVLRKTGKIWVIWDIVFLKIKIDLKNLKV